MFCEFCGSKLRDGAKFCENCGARIEIAAPIYPPADEAVGGACDQPDIVFDRPDTAYDQSNATYDQPNTSYSRPGASYSRPGASYSRPGASNAQAGSHYAEKTQQGANGFSVTAKPEMRILGIPVRGKGIWIALGVIALAVIVILVVTKLGGSKKTTEEENASRPFEVRENTERSGSGSKPQTEKDLSEIAGLYKLSYMNTEEDGDLAEELEMMEALGLTITMRLDPDGTGVMDIYGDGTDELSWDENELNIDGDTVRYTYDNGVITLEDDGNRMVFSRITDAELRDIQDTAGKAGVLDGRTDPEAVAGYYYATACFSDGESAALDDEYLYLDADGTGWFSLLDIQYSLRWQLDGQDFYFLDESGDEFIGTLSDGVIEGDYFDGYSYVLERETSSPREERAQGAGDTGARDFYEFTTADRPTLADFQWLDYDIARGALPAGREPLDTFDEVSGGWKCYLIDDIDGEYNSTMERFLNVYVTGTPESADVTLDWFYVYDGSADQGFDDDTPDSEFSGSWSDGEISAVGSGRVSLTDFWYLDGYEYALGTFMWPDGVPALIALVRP